MKKILGWALIASFMIACNDSSDSTKTETDSITRSTNNDSSNVSVQPLDAESTTFVTDVTKGGMLEIDLGNFAQQNARNQRVKDFGAMMVRDHTAANNELMQIASSRNVTLPSSIDSMQQRHKDDMTKKTGSSFDKEYMKMMVDNHTKTITKFEKAAQSTDASIKAFADKYLPTVRTHLDSAKAISRLKL